MRIFANRRLAVIGCVVLAGAFSAAISARGASSAIDDRFTGGDRVVGAAVAFGQRAVGAAPPTTFVCNQVIAMTLTREWYVAGFEQAPGIIDDRWQLKARQSGYITEWANPNSDFWNQAVQSPCANGSASPDHVVLTVLSWTPQCCTTPAEWEAVVTNTVTTLKAKYAGLKRVDLMTVVRGPENKNCPTPPARGETVSMQPEFEAGLAAVAAKFPNMVFVGPKVEAPNCAAFVGGGPHLTPAGNAEVAKAIAAHFVKLQ